MIKGHNEFFAESRLKTAASQIVTRPKEDSFLEVQLLS